MTELGWDAWRWAKAQVDNGATHKQVAEALCEAMIEIVPEGDVRLPGLEGAYARLAKVLGRDPEVWSA